MGPWEDCGAGADGESGRAVGQVDKDGGRAEVEEIRRTKEVLVGGAQVKKGHYVGVNVTVCIRGTERATG